MKKITFSLLLALATVSFAYAQLSIIRKHGGHIINDSTIKISGPASSLITDSLYVINSGGSFTSVDARRDIISQINGSDNWFCWGANCFAPTVNTSKGNEAPVVINMGDTNKTFYCDYNAGGNLGTSFIRYVFFNDANSADSSWVIVEYNATATGINNISGGNINFSTPYPNPANSYVNFNYSLSNGVQSANLKIFNLLGDCVQTLPLSPLKNKTSIDVQSMPSGIYVCEVEANGCQPAYQKMIVSH